MKIIIIIYKIVLTIDLGTAATVHKKISDDDIFPTYVHEEECQVQSKKTEKNVLDCMLKNLISNLIQMQFPKSALSSKEHQYNDTMPRL